MTENDGNTGRWRGLTKRSWCRQAGGRTVRGPYIMLILLSLSFSLSPALCAPPALVAAHGDPSTQQHREYSPAAATRGHSLKCGCGRSTGPRYFWGIFSLCSPLGSLTCPAGGRTWYAGKCGSGFRGPEARAAAMTTAPGRALIEIASSAPVAVEFFLCF